MSFAGLAIATRLFNKMLNLNNILPNVIDGIAIIIFVILLISYLLKIILFPAKIKTEFSNQITVNFYGTIPIAFLLISVVIGNYNQGISLYLWSIGVVFTLLAGYNIIYKLIKEEVSYDKVIPAWLIGGVASIDIAATSPVISNNFLNELNLLGLSIGTGLAIIFYILILHILINRSQMAQASTPSLMILIAPFAVGFLGYTNYFNSIDAFASMLLYFSLFMFLVILPQIFKKGISFNINWCAIGFPVAALVSANIKYAIYTQFIAFKIIATLLILFLMVSILIISVKTLISLFNGKLLSAN